jgi:hypothetical protein
MMLIVMNATTTWMVEVKWLLLLHHDRPLTNRRVDDM